jgi:TPR repeat protein
MTPPLSEWLAYHLIKSVGYYGAWALFLAIPTAFVMWGCIGFLGWYGGLRMTKRTRAATWGITAMAGLGVTLLGIMSISTGGPSAVANVRNEGPSENGQAAYQQHDNVGHAIPLEDGDAAYQRHDYPTALQVWRPLADRGDAWAQYGLGVMYYNGEGVSQDYSGAVKWFRLAADQGLANAQHNLGYMYAKGEGVSQDYSGAVKWFRKAADQGFANAQNNLGALYAKGEGVSRDYSEAVKWYRKAADQGFAEARANLARLKQ